MTNNIRKRWWFLARLSIALGFIVCLLYGTGALHKQGAGMLLAVILIIFAWAYAMTINQLRNDYEKVKRSRRKKY